MWSKQQTVAEPPAVSPSQAPASPVVPFNQPSSGKLGGAPARGSARLGASIQIKGQVTGTEDLQIDGIVDGPISLKGHELTVGSTAQLTSEIHAGEGTECQAAPGLWSGLFARHHRQNLA